MEGSCDSKCRPLIPRFQDFMSIFHLVPSLAWLTKDQNVFYLYFWHLSVNLIDIWIQKVLFLPEWVLIICGYSHISKSLITEKSAKIAVDLPKAARENVFIILIQIGRWVPTNNILKILFPTFNILWAITISDFANIPPGSSSRNVSRWAYIKRRDITLFLFKLELSNLVVRENLSLKTGIIIRLTKFQRFPNFKVMWSQIRLEEPQPSHKDKNFI